MEAKPEEALLFGAEYAAEQTMNDQVSLSTVLLLIVAALTAHQLFRWCSVKQNGYIKIQEPAGSGTHFQFA